MVWCEVIKWGRLGNSLIQLENVILVAIENGFNVRFPSHTFLNSNTVILNPSSGGGKSHKGVYFNKKEIPFKQSNNIVRSNQIIRELFKIKWEVIEPINHLVIHIRSGDIFSKKPHPGYVMPPLAYYRKIIDEGNWSHIEIIAEDRKNPCINALLELYSGRVSHKIRKLEDDIKIILGACHIVCSYGTFIPSLLQLTEHTRHIYCASYDLSIKGDNRYANGVEIHRIDLTNYKNAMGAWKNTPVQISLMLNTTL